MSSQKCKTISQDVDPNRTMRIGEAIMRLTPKTGIRIITLETKIICSTLEDGTVKQTYQYKNKILYVHRLERGRLIIISPYLIYFDSWIKPRDLDHWDRQSMKQLGRFKYIEWKYGQKARKSAPALGFKATLGIREKHYQVSDFKGYL